MNYFKKIKVLFKDIYPIEKRESDKLVHLWGYYVTRPISMVITPIFIKYKVSANTATNMGFFIGVSSLVLGSFGYITLSVILYNCFFVFDSIDGNLARYYGPSKYGELLDAMSGNIINFLFLPCLSIGIETFDLSYFYFFKNISNHLMSIAFFSTLILTISLLIAKDRKLILGGKISLKKENDSAFRNILDNIFRNSFGMAIAGPFSILGVIFNIIDIFILYNLVISIAVLLFCILSIILLK